MLDGEKESHISYPFEKFLSVVNVILSTIICLRIAQTIGTGLFPLPGLYLLELISVSVAATFATFQTRSPEEFDWGLIIWAAAGIFLSFSILGAWSIGFFFLPSALLLLLSGVLSDHRRGRNILLHVGMGLLAGTMQAVIMLNAYRIFYPNAFSVG
jgi:hypothetical protein